MDCGAEACPVLAVGADEGCEGFVGSAVVALEVAVQLGVEGGGEVELGVGKAVEGTPEDGGEAGVAVRDYALGPATPLKLV